ncbi:MAG: radical SAM protein [Syntrophales bacterium]|jgi:histone acetyltransferase (RNA polymerase elongator complex component)|nr:radical SAM protein [Syntrophales bacterium]MCK9528201.1 radical SAM protein [Syntrophales bacterium]MDX9921348.1 radical SAM protein [Syntrophales bacterium]
MKRLIIPIFIMNRGCPNRCIFCNESITAGNYTPDITVDSFTRTVEACLATAKDRYQKRQIAFYGGNFTGLGRDEQEELLGFTLPYIETGKIHSLRLSTRPDHLDNGTLRYLFSRQVRTIEVGVQSFDDEVLARSNRGHTGEDARRAVGLLAREGFETGVHLMAGLPGDTAEGFIRTVEQTIDLSPRTVRIHPTIVFRDTALARLYGEGRYRPLSLDEAVNLCAVALARFTAARIPVIRIGLQVTEEMLQENAVLAGPFHPSLRSLVDATVFKNLALLLLNRVPSKAGELRFFLSPSDTSRFRGPRNSTVDYLNHHLGRSRLSILEDNHLAPGSLRLVAGTFNETLSVASRGDELAEMIQQSIC